MKKRKPWRFLLKALVFITLITGLLIASVFLTFVFMDRSQLGAARKAGIGIEPGDLSHVARPTAENNSATYYRQAIDLMHAANATTGLQTVAMMFQLGTGIDRTELARQKTTLKPFRAALEMAELGAAKAQCDFGRDMTLGNKFQTPEYEPIKRLIKFECIAAVIDAFDGHPQDAVRHFEVGTHMTRDLGSEPNFDSQRAFVSAQGMVLHALISVFPYCGRNPSFVKQTEGLMESLSNPKPLRFYAEGDLILNRIVIHQLPDLPVADLDRLLSIADTENNPGYKNLEKFMRWRILNPLFDANFVSLYSNFIQALPADESNWPALRAAGITADRASSDASLPSLYTTMFAKQLRAICSSSVKSLARARLMNASLKLLLQQAQAGKLPGRLPDFGKDSLDPFSGKPFGYETQGAGFKLFSVGPEGRSNGRRFTQDLVFDIAEPLGSRNP